MSTIGLDEQAVWTQLLDETAAANAAVELAPLGSNAGWRVRLLAMEQQTLVLEHPPIASEGSALREGQELEVRLLEQQARWILRCRVIERLQFALSGTQVPAVRLSWPSEVQRTQRRAHFRVATVGQDRPELRLWMLQDLATAVQAEEALQEAWRNRHTKPVDPSALPRPTLGQELQAMAVDVSGGGLCVVTPVQVTAMLKQNPLLWLELSVPGEPLPMMAAAKVAHWERQQGLMRVGLAFTYDHHPRHEAFMADQLCRATMAIQRQQLRRGGRP